MAEIRDFPTAARANSPSDGRLIKNHEEDLPKGNMKLPPLEPRGNKVIEKKFLSAETFVNKYRGSLYNVTTL